MNSSNFCPLQSVPISGPIKENYTAYTCNAGSDVSVKNRDDETKRLNVCLQDSSSKGNSKSGEYLRYFYDGSSYFLYCASSNCLNKDQILASLRRTDWLYKYYSLGHDKSFIISSTAEGKAYINTKGGTGS
jgi:hypothetical protein